MMKHYAMDLRSRLRGKKENNKGFTLVELIVVIVILAILAAILIPGLLKWIDEARDKQYQLEARSIYMATEGELTKEYGKQVAYTGDSIEWTGDSNGHIVEIERLSGLDVRSVTIKVNRLVAEGNNPADWTITEFTTTFKPSNAGTGGADITMKWTNTANEWVKQ